MKNATVRAMNALLLDGQDLFVQNDRHKGFCQRITKVKTVHGFMHAQLLLAETWRVMHTGDDIVNYNGRTIWKGLT